MKHKYSMILYRLQDKWSSVTLYAANFYFLWLPDNHAWYNAQNATLEKCAALRCELK